LPTAKSISKRAFWSTQQNFFLNRIFYWVTDSLTDAFKQAKHWGYGLGFFIVQHRFFLRGTFWYISVHVNMRVYVQYNAFFMDLSVSSMSHLFSLTVKSVDLLVAHESFPIFHNSYCILLIAEMLFEQLLINFAVNIHNKVWIWYFIFQCIVHFHFFAWFSICGFTSHYNYFQKKKKSVQKNCFTRIPTLLKLRIIFQWHIIIIYVLIYSTINFRLVILLNLLNALMMTGYMDAILMMTVMKD